MRYHALQILSIVPMVSLLVFPIHGSVMDIMNVLMAVMNASLCVVGIHFLTLGLLKKGSEIYIFVEKWKCEEDKFLCGIGQPRCISQTRKCNKLNDCSDGSDEFASICSECHPP